MFCKNCWANLPDDTEQCSKCGLDPRVVHEADAHDSEDSQGQAPPAWLGNTSVPDTSKTPEKPSRCPVKNITLQGEPSRKDPVVRIVFVVAMLIVIGGGVYHYKTTSKELSLVELADSVGPEFARIESVAADLAPAGPVLVPQGAGLAEQSLVQLASSGPVVKVDTDIPGYVRDFNAGSKAFKAGNYADAAFYYKEAYKAASPEDKGFETIKINLARSLTALGWKIYGERDFQSAKDYFEEANEHYMEDSSLKGYGYSQASLEDYAGAVDSLTRLLKEYAPDVDVKKTLKQVYVRLADQELSGSRTASSVRLMQQAQALDPDDENISSRLKALKRESDHEAGFSERRGSRFNVKFEGGENAVTGNVIAILLEAAYQVIGTELSYYPDTPISAVLYSKEGFRDVTRSPAWAGALYDGRIKIPTGGITEKTSKLEAVLFHEYTHAVVHRIAKGRAPTWLNEGLAQYLENKREADYSRILTSTAGDGVRLSHLEGSFMGMDTNSAALAYSVSLSATEYIIREYGIYACKRILEELGSGRTLAQAVSSVLFISYDELQDSWQRYLKRKYSD